MKPALNHKRITLKRNELSRSTKCGTSKPVSPPLTFLLSFRLIYACVLQTHLPTCPTNNQNSTCSKPIIIFCQTCITSMFHILVNPPNHPRQKIWGSPVFTRISNSVSRKRNSVVAGLTMKHNLLNHLTGKSKGGSVSK